MDDNDVVVAKQTFAYRDLIFHAGRTRVRRDHPACQDNPGYFEELDATIHYPSVEQATRAPGRRRGE